MKKVFFGVIVSIMFFSCQKELNRTSTELPSISTTTITSVTSTSAASGGNITDDGGATILARGVCWSNFPNPVITDSHTIDSEGVGVFTSAVKDLAPLTTYYIRAYATNSVGTAYGNEISFTTTNNPIALPTLTTALASSISTTTVISGGDISADGGAMIIERGVCWSTISNPMDTDDHANDGSGVGEFTITITNLLPATKYFARAYAKNSEGIAYGNEINFTTNEINKLPTVTTNLVTGINSVEAFGGGNITVDGGYPVVSRGVCWSNSPNPVITDKHSTDGNGTGTFNSVFIDLKPLTTYYVRAYATNSFGTAYGNEITFTTTNPSVYVAGLVWNDKYSVATIWKDGVEMPLTDGNSNSRAYSVYVSGTDVYVAGSEVINSKYVARIWKNGVGTSLETAANNTQLLEATAVFVSGSDVFVCGIKQNSQARYWKNGVLTILEILNSSAQTIFMSATDMYVGGSKTFYTQNQNVAMIWKNGTEIPLTNGINGAYVNSIYVDGADVYASGGERLGARTKAKLWKNGVSYDLFNHELEGFATGVFVHEKDVYVCGYENNGNRNIAKLWKNGTETTLSNGVNNWSAYSIYVAGTDVYVAGSESTPAVGTVAKYFKNGVETALSNGNTTAFAASVFVK